MIVIRTVSGRLPPVLDDGRSGVNPNLTTWIARGRLSTLDRSRAFFKTIGRNGHSVVTWLIAMTVQGPNNIDRGDLSHEQWEWLQPLLPPQKPHTGCPAQDHRMVINRILWILRTGTPWRDLPKRYGAWSTVTGRFYRWRKTGLWQQILTARQAEADVELLLTRKLLPDMINVNTLSGIKFKFILQPFPHR